MALTVIRANVPNVGITNIGFETQIVEEVQFLTVRRLDDNMQTITLVDQYELVQNEIDFHKDLRETAAQKKHLITQFCTNPEWNPENYCKTLKDFQDEERNQ